MRILIDTGCWLWSLAEPERLNKRSRDLLGDPANTLYLSAASSWEIALKFTLGKLMLPEPPEKYIPSRMEAFGIEGLPVEHAHALRVSRLPLYHRDPFDRLLVAQGQIDSLTILTGDPALLAYEVRIIWAGRRRPPGSPNRPPTRRGERNYSIPG